MSEKTFWETAHDTLYPIAVIEQVIELIEAHDGTIVWEVEPTKPPPPAVCTCSDIEDNNFPIHMEGCPFHEVT